MDGRKRSHIHLRSKSFRRTWLLALLATSVLPMLAAFFLVIQMTHREALDHQREWFLENANSIGNQAQAKIDNIALAKTVLSTFLSRYLSETDVSVQQNINSLQSFLNMRDSIMSTELVYNIDRIRIFSDRLPFLSKGDRLTFYPISDLEGFGADRDNLTSQTKEGVLQYIIVDAPHAYIKARSQTLYTPTRMYAFYGNIFSMNGELIAVYMLEYNAEHFLDDVSSSLDNTIISLTDDDGTVIRCSGKAPTSFRGEGSKTDAFIERRTLLPLNWQLTVETEKSILAVQNSLMILYIGIILVAFIASVIISRIVSRRTIDRLNNYLEAVCMDDAGAEQLLQRLTSLVESSDAQDELDHIMMTFCKLIRDNLILITEVNQHKLELERYKYKVLREEINPHFLYNALDTMRLCIVIGEREQATRALDALSRFYRIALSRGQDEITLAEELNMVTSYLELENIGYEGQIQWRFSIDPDLNDCLVPKFILQPLIENSIVHGMLPDNSSAFHIAITVRRADGRIEIVVEDDGRGIDTGLVDSMNKQLAGDVDIEKLGFGLVNVNQRVKLMYGTQYGLTIDSGSKGVRVSIFLPEDLK